MLLRCRHCRNIFKSLKEAEDHKRKDGYLHSNFWLTEENSVA